MDEARMKQELIKLADTKYREFHKNLCPTMHHEMLGVRIPSLRNYAKALLKEQKANQLLEMIGNEYYEEIMLKGMVIGLSKEETLQTVQKRIENFVPQIDNWAVCDTFCAGLKITKQYKKEMWAFIQPYLTADEEFSVRFGVVMLLDYYVEEPYLPHIFNILDDMYMQNLKQPYYVQMAVAWLLAECLTKAYEKTEQYLKETKIDEFTFRKTVQKARESFRITKEQKENLKKLQKPIC